MQENNNEGENEIINEESKPIIDQNKINNPPPQNNENNENYKPENSSIPIINSEEENKIKNEEDIINKENKNIINNNINNNNKENNIFLNFPLIKKNIKSYNFDNLSKEEKMERIENILHSLLSEISTLKEKGNEFYKNKNYEEAERQYIEGIKKINESSLLPDIDELNGQINNYLISINGLNLQLYNNLSAALIKQEKYEETIKNCKFIIENLNEDHVVSYCRMLFCLIEIKKIILANHYAEIIKKKFGNENSISKFQEQFAKLEVLNREFSEKILNQNPELKKEIASMNEDLKVKNEDKKEENNIKKYIPYMIGGAFLLFAGGRYIYKKLKKND